MINEAEIIEYFDSLTYEEQRSLYGKLTEVSKPPNYFISFDLTKNRGLVLLTKTVSYCKRRDIKYTAKKISDWKLTLVFEGIRDRNSALFGAMIELGVKKEEIKDKNQENILIK